MMGYGWTGNGMVWGMGWLPMLAFWGLVLAGVVLVFRWLSSGEPLPGSGARRAETPGEILAKRYARGEIDREEFESRKQDLSA